ncbi:B12-binding domain-containing radical SAM protein, partial [Thermodesulfobacteriota bacterium]
MRKKSIVLVQAPYLEDYGPMRKAAGTYFPIGLGYISSFLKQHGYIATLLDPNVQTLSPDQIVDSVCREKPVCVGISFMTPQFFWARKLARVLKNASLGTPIVLGGAHPSALPEQTLTEITNADFVVFGEGEQTTLELMDYLAKGKMHLDEIEGLVWRRNDEVIVNSPRTPIADLDTLPYPDRDLIGQHLYRAQSFLSYSSKTTTIHTSRGCPGRCVFCASGHKLRTRVRERSISNIMREIDYLKGKFHIDYLLIKDDTFTLRPSRVEEFCDVISER